MVGIPAFRSHFFWLRFVEFWLCMLCFILTMQFNQVEMNMFDEIQQTKINVTVFEMDRPGFTRINIIAIATCAYTWIILPVILLTYAFDSDFLDKSILCPLFAFFGFFMFISAGSLMCARSQGDSGAQAAGAFCIITSLVYIGDIAFLAFKRFTQLQEPPQA